MTDAEPTLPEMVNQLDRKLDDVVGAVELDAQSRDRQTAMLEKKLRTARRSIRISVAALAAVAILLGLKWRDDRHQEQARQDLLVANCLSTNNAREKRETRDEQIGGLLLDAAIDSTPAASPEAAAIRGELLERIKANYVAKMRDTWPVELRPRNCSEASVTEATVVGSTGSG